MKLPAFQFYPADWRKDPAVQALDYHDRGVWFEMICLMHESSERGVLLLNGQPMSEEVLARLLGLDKQTMSDALTKILCYGAARRRECDGAIYSHRMVKDERLIQIRRDSGKKGGNPVLLNQIPTTGDKQKPTPSSSSSPSATTDSKKSRIQDAPVVFPTNLDTPEFHKAWGDYCDYRKQSRYAKLKPASVQSQLSTLASWGQEDAIQSIQTTIRNGWQGLFPVRRTITHSPEKAKSLIQFA
jgi:hypothetical protein